MRLPMIAACVMSCGMHAGILFFLPAPSFQYTPPPKTPSDVELVTVAVPLPPALQSVPADTSSENTPSPPTTPTYDASKITPPDLQRLDGAVERTTSGLSMQLTMPALQLPPPRPEADTQEQVPLPLPDTTGVVAAMLEPSPVAPGKAAGTDKQLGLGEVPLGTKQSPSRMGMPQVDARLVAPPRPTNPPFVASPALEPQFGIQGPVAKREPLVRPPPPSVQIHSESDIALKFWVRPDGVVSRVIPERKGDAALEAVAMRYLEGWRFTPLPPYEPQEEQWGTITIRFLLPKRGAQN